MPEKGLEEEIETKKILTRKLNKFLNDYFNRIIILVVIIIFIFGFFFLIQPKYVQTIKYVNLINKQEKSDFQTKNEELKKIKELLSVYSSIDHKYVDKVNAIAPVKKNKEELFSEINYLVSRNQLFLQSVSLEDLPGYQDKNLLAINAADARLAEDIQSVNIVLSVRGTDYEAFKNFLSALENNLRLMDVVSVDFDPIAKTTDLVINTYYTK